MKRRITATILAVLLILCAFAGCTAKNENKTLEDAFLGTWSFEGGMTLAFSKGDAQYKFVLGIEGMTVDGIYSANETVLNLSYADGSSESLDYVFENGALVINGGMVFEKTAGGVNKENLTAAQILIYSVVGFLVVFAVLLVLYVIMVLQGKIFDKATKKVEAVTEQTPDVATEDEVLLVNVDDESAAMIMAIVADETGIPLEELYFKSIRLIEEGEEVK